MVFQNSIFVMLRNWVDIAVYFYPPLYKVYS